MHKDTILDKLILEKVADNNLEIGKISEQINTLANLSKQLKADNAEYILTYQSNCPHTALRTKESKYSEGGYDYRSETVYTFKCSRCNKVMDTKVEHGYYA